MADRVAAVDLGDVLNLGASRIVVVDDVPENTLLLRRILERAGLTRVEAFTDPRAALQHCLDSPPDLLILDLHMPDLDGLSFLDEIHEHLPYDVFLPAIFLTADASGETKRRVLAAGAKDFLTKPLDRVEVVFRVRNTLETAQFYKAVSQRNRYLQRFIEERTLSERQQRARRTARRARIDGVLTDDALRVVFQPICELGSSRVVGFESLSRFSADPPRPPDQWFAEAADVGLGPELEMVAARKAVGFLAGMPDEDFLSINASPAVIMHAELEELCATDPERIVVELTEQSPVVDYPAIVDTLGRLRDMGVRIAVDDAGAGFAGLEALVRLRPDVIKLDRSLVAGIHCDPARRAMALSLVFFAKDIGATVIGEGIEQPDELAVLTELGCDWGQGFLLGVPAEAVPPDWPAQWLVATA